MKQNQKNSEEEHISDSNILKKKLKSLIILSVFLVFLFFVCLIFFNTSDKLTELVYGDIVAVQIEKGSPGERIFKFIRLRNENGKTIQKQIYQFNDDQLDEYSYNYMGPYDYAICQNRQKDAWCLYLENYCRRDLNLLIIKKGNNKENLFVKKFNFPDLTGGYEYIHLRGINSQGTEFIKNSGYVFDLDVQKLINFGNNPNDNYHCNGAVYLDDNTIIYQYDNQNDDNKLDIGIRQHVKNNFEAKISSIKQNLTIKQLSVQAGKYPTRPSYRDDMLLSIDVSNDSRTIIFWALYTTGDPENNGLWLCQWDIQSGKTEKICEFPYGYLRWKTNEIIWNPIPEKQLIAVLIEGDIYIVDARQKKIIKKIDGISCNYKNRDYVYSKSRIHWSPDGSFLYILDSGQKLRSYEPSTGKLREILPRCNFTDFFFIK